MKSIKPQYLGSVAILFWGMQSDLLWFALPMAVILELRYFINTRWAITKKDFYQMADLTGVGLGLIVIFLWLNRQEYHFITTLLIWVPILIYPLTALLAYSTTSRLTLDVLFYSLRKQREPVNQSWDMDYVLLASCLLAAGFNTESRYYLPVVGLIVILALYQLRSLRWSRPFVAAFIALSIAAAFTLQFSLRKAHLEIKDTAEALIANWISERTDPLKTRTSIGQVGQMKLSDAIAFRIEPLSGSPDFPRLLTVATYNSPGKRDWQVFDLRFRTEKNADDFRWEFAAGPQALYPEAKIYKEFDRSNALIPVPAELTEINELPATELKSSIYGTFQGRGLIPSPHYRVRYQTAGDLGDPPSAADLLIPEKYEETLSRITPNGLAEPDAIGFIQNYFSDFRYTLYQSGNAIQEEPLVHFLQESKAGHCEYFASATAIMLRKMGIPSRYVVGYVVQEWHEGMDMYIVRKRHAHAWTTAFVDNEWVVIDTTPAEWIGIEESSASWLQPLQDIISNNVFLILRWWNSKEIEEYKRELLVFVTFIALILIWRMRNSKRVLMEDKTKEKRSDLLKPGHDSPFFQIEKQLIQMGYGRNRGELMSKWLIRIEHQDLLPLLNRHNCLRFDPQGLHITEKEWLRDKVFEWLEDHRHVSPPNEARN